MVGLDNQVLRGEKTKDIALEMMDSLFVAQEVAFKSIKDFYGKEPNEAAFNGVEFMLGNLFIPGVAMADLTALVTEASERRTQAVMRAAPHIETMADVPDLYAQYEQLIGLYTTISNLRAEREKTAKDVN